VKHGGKSYFQALIASFRNFRIVHSPPQNHASLKKLMLLTAAACLMGLFANAQTVVNDRLSIEADGEPDTGIAVAKLPTQQGSSFIGCNILLAQLDAAEFNTDKSMHYRVGASPRYGYFLANNIALVGALNGNIDGYTRINEYTITAGGEVFARFYTGKVANKKGDLNKLRFFIEGGVGYGYMFDRVAEGSTTASMEFGVVQAHLMPGVNYFANRNVAFELGLDYGYQHTVMNEDLMKDDHHSLLLSIGLQFFFCKR
jgi:hypothetical protein